MIKKIKLRQTTNNCRSMEIHIQKILVPSDLSPSAHRAFDLAHDLARRQASEVHVLHVESGSSTVQQEKVREQITGRFQDEADKLRWVRRAGRVSEEILRYADEEDIDLITMGTHGRRSLAHPVLGGTTGAVVRESSRPVLTVREQEDIAAHAEAPSVEHILVPMDFSEHAEEAAKVARAFAAAYGASLTLLFVAEEHTVPLFSDTGLPNFTTVKMDPNITSQADQALRQFYENMGGADVPADYQVRKGHPAREILRASEEKKADLIVMSTHGQSGYEHFTLGSVTEKVVRKAAAPVLTLKAFGRTLLADASSSDGAAESEAAL